MKKTQCFNGSSQQLRIHDEKTTNKQQQSNIDKTTTLIIIWQHKFIGWLQHSIQTNSSSKDTQPTMVKKKRKGNK